MSDINPADIPATIKFQSNVKPLQEEYKNALKTGTHPEKELMIRSDIVGHYFGKQCQIIYEEKLDILYSSIIEYHKNSGMSHIDLPNYPRFKELLWDAKHKTYIFLDAL